MELKRKRIIRLNDVHSIPCQELIYSENKANSSSCVIFDQRILVQISAVEFIP